VEKQLGYKQEDVLTLTALFKALYQEEADKALEEYNQVCLGVSRLSGSVIRPSSRLRRCFKQMIRLFTSDLLSRASFQVHVTELSWIEK
jgi:hypothetical protein